MNEPAIANIQLRTDRDYADTFTFYASRADVCSGTRLALTGTNYIAQIRPELNSATLTLDLDVDFSDIANGAITISSSASNHAATAVGQYPWDLLEIDSNGDKIPVIEGIATITGTVSRL